MRLLELRRDKPDLTIELISGEAVSETVGCTGVIVFVGEQYYTCANLGDSLAMLARRTGEGLVSMELTKAHNLDDADEVARVVAAGHSVCGAPPRVDGMLAVSRSFGDYQFKRVEGLGPELQPVSNTPHIIREERNENDEFLIICCDGIYEVMTGQQVVDFIGAALAAGTPAPEVLTALMDNCIAADYASRALGGDNMTAMLVLLGPVEDQEMANTTVGGSGS